MKARQKTWQETRRALPARRVVAARRAWAAGLMALATVVVGCQADEPAVAAKPTTTVTKPDPYEPPTVDAEATPSPGPDGLSGGAVVLGRSTRRMRLDTLQAAMTKVAGNDVDGQPIEWKYNGQNGFSDAAFGKALGRPDFNAANDEQGVPSALYLKFVGDAARDICMQMAKNDQLRADPTTRTLFPKAPVDDTATDAQVTENVQYLLLHFLGLRVAPDHSMVTSLVAVHAAGEGATPDGAELTPGAEGWRGVCVTLFESPLFHND